jgi:signal transduction histidine kinase
MNNNLTETYDLLVSIIGNAPYGTIAIDLNGNINLCNKLALVQLNIPHRIREVTEKPLIDYTTNIPKLHKRLLQCLEKERKAFNLNNVVIDDKILNIKGRLIANGMIITTSDITEAKATERRIMNAVLEGQENERRRLAKEIHDGIGPLMSTLKLNIESVKKDLDDASEKTMMKMESMEELVHHVAEDIRNISHSLMPSALKDFGLISALENLVLKVNQLGAVEVKLFHVKMEERLDEVLELGLYRIAQELLNNALKYAQAKNITIHLVNYMKAPRYISLTVEDDGIGFEEENIEEHMDTGIGLSNVKVRAEAMNGSLSIDTSPGNGVVAIVEVPWRKKEGLIAPDMAPPVVKQEIPEAVKLDVSDKE